MEATEAIAPLRVAQPETTPQHQRTARLVIDQPVRAAAALGRGGLGITLAAGAAGLFGVSVCTLLAQAILSAPGVAGAGIAPLPPLLDAMAFVVPAAVGGAWLRLQVSLRVLAGAFSVGLLQAAVVAASLLPMAVFVAAISDMAALQARSPLAHILIADLIVPFAALLTLVHRIGDTVTRLDARPAVSRGAQAAGVAVCAVFILRALAQLGG